VLRVSKCSRNRGGSEDRFIAAVPLFVSGVQLSNPVVTSDNNILVRKPT
jgi:hypothetical protein